MLTPAELALLLASIAKSDQAAFERLYEATRAKLFGVVLRILRRPDLAEEVVQEAYVRIWTGAGQFDPAKGSAIAWMVSMARNRAIDMVRKRGVGSIDEQPDEMDALSDIPPPLARRDMADELKHVLDCVGQLDQQRQKLLLLAYYNGWSREQLAEKFNTPLNDVRTWLRRSLVEIGENLGLM